jgi:hypothetical protein
LAGPASQPAISNNNGALKWQELLAAGTAIQDPKGFASGPAIIRSTESDKRLVVAMTVQELFKAVSDAPTGCDSSSVAYDGHGRLFAIGNDSLLRSVDVRRHLASSTIKLNDFQTTGEA